MEPAQKSEFSQLRLKQTQKNLSLTDNTDTAVHAWIALTCERQLYPQGFLGATLIGLRVAIHFWVAKTGTNQV